ncbi:MAG: hypothetical protein NXI13_05155 [Proteobacteria bacterium]|nr:hypothetical protein [Pseudomonadota bacterium]
MQKHIRVPVLILALAFTLTACQEGSSVSESVGGLLKQLPFTGSAEENVVVKGSPIKSTDLPWHLKSAIAATVLRVKGSAPGPIEADLNVIGSGGIATDAAANYENFGVQNVMINDFFHPQGEPEIYRLGARVIMVDPSGRRFALSFVADYELAEDQVILRGHDWGYIRSISPGLETYIIPAEALKTLNEKTARDYIAFRKAILSNSINPGSSSEYAPSADYAIVTFVLDRLQEGDKFELRISDVKKGLKVLRDPVEGFSEDSRYIVHDNGWVTGVVAGNFSLGAGKAFFIKAIYTPKEDEGAVITFAKGEQLIGMFNTANITTARNE